MALTEEQKRKIEEEERYKSQVLADNNHSSHKQKHGVPAIISLFIPGLGQLIKGQAGKGILIFIGVIVGLFLFVLPGIIIWIWQISDAYNN